MTTLSALLKTAVDMRGSDLHLTTGAPPVVRVDGDLRRVDGHDVLTDLEVREVVYSHLSPEQRRTFEEESELDLALDIVGIARVRCNVFRQRGDVAAVYRLVPDRIPSVDELGLPLVVADFATLPRGLVLVTGPTGSGKSTTLAALIDTINVVRRSHILTVEDPIEYLHTHKQGIVNQREVRVDTGRTIKGSLTSGKCGSTPAIVPRPCEQPSARTPMSCWSEKCEISRRSRRR